VSGLQFAANSLNVKGRYRENDSMGKTILAMVAAAAIGTALFMADIACARAGAVNATPGAGSGGGLHGRSIAGPRGGFFRRGGSIHRRDGARVHRGAAHARRRAFGASVLDAGAPLGVPLYEYAPGVPPNCQVRRVQIDDDDGWRVRDMVVCPPSGRRPADGVE
jgi:hypothetical protein